MQAETRIQANRRSRCRAFPTAVGCPALPLVEAAFAWARAMKPTQPLTVGAWADFGSPMSKRMMELSDVVSFHACDAPGGVRSKLEICRAYGRPVLCTEWLNRPGGNTFASILPIFAEHGVGCYHWGLVAGRTQTYMPWGSKKGDPMPALWQHDVFHPDCTGYGCRHGRSDSQRGGRELDQGYWPDAIYTAPTDDALRYDIEMTKKLGMNVARKHVKVEPDRWYYWCDKLGLLVWQDMPSAGPGPGAVGQGAGRNKQTGEMIDGKPISPEASAQFEAELKAMVEGRRNHPSIVMWIVFNEGWGQYDTPRLTKWVKGLDPSRLVNNASGGLRRVRRTDLYADHGRRDRVQRRAHLRSRDRKAGSPKSRRRQPRQFSTLAVSNFCTETQLRRRRHA